MAGDPEVFEDFEREHSLFDVRADGIPVWERVRFDVYRDIYQQNRGREVHSANDGGMRDYLRGFRLFLQNVVRKNPFLADDPDLLVFGHPRRKQQDDGLWWDIYCDPIYEHCDLDYVHVESPYLLQHLGPARTEHLRYRELITYGGDLQQLLGLNEPTIPDEMRRKLRSAERAIAEKFDADVDLVEHVRTSLHERRTELWLYRRLLDRLDPELVVVVVSYSNETLIEACKERGVPVAELQHGVIHESHFGYSYRGDRTKEMFPDYLLTFGEFWNERITFPIPDDRILTVGYPHLESCQEKHREVDSEEKMVFLSQGTIGDELSKFALEVANCPSVEHEVVYKLHPGEYDRWWTDYPWLRDADFEVVDSPDRSLHRLFAESTVQVGVGSTAIYEGLLFDLETYIYDCPGSETIQPLIDENVATKVHNVDELVTGLGTNRAEFERARFFANDATENICRTLRELVTESSTFSPQ